MAKNTDADQSGEDRRDPGSDDRREGEHVTVRKLFNDYGFEDERKAGSRRDAEHQKES